MIRAATWLAVASGLASLAGATPARADAAVELLHRSDARVAVSSQVSNPAHRPEHLVDGDPETAWSSRSGDLAGAWLAFRVPREARVSAIKLIVGFAHVDPRSKADWFAMNHRVTRVRVLREGQVLGEADLDPEARQLQSIVVSAPGGDFRIEVMRVQPGTRKDWREVCLSELEVWGTAPAELLHEPAPPPVLVGSLDPRPRPDESCHEAGRERGRFRPPREDEVVLRICDVAELSQSPRQRDEGFVEHLRQAELAFADGSGRQSLGEWTDGWEWGSSRRLLGTLSLGKRDALVVMESTSGTGNGLDAVMQHLVVLGFDPGATSGRVPWVGLYDRSGNQIHVSFAADGGLAITTIVPTEQGAERQTELQVTVKNGGLVEKQLRSSVTPPR
jgi:hypothetical protein